MAPISEKSKQYQTWYPSNKKISEIRTKTASGDITITGNKKVGNLEKEFETVYGLYAQVCIIDKDGTGYYTSGKYDAMTLTAINKYGENDGWKKFKY